MKKFIAGLLVSFLLLGGVSFAANPTSVTNEKNEIVGYVNEDNSIDGDEKEIVRIMILRIKQLEAYVKVLSNDLEIARLVNQKNAIEMRLGQILPKQKAVPVKKSSKKVEKKSTKKVKKKSVKKENKKAKKKNENKSDKK